MTTSERRTSIATVLGLQIVLALICVAIIPRYTVGNVRLAPITSLYGAAAGTILFLAFSGATLPRRAAFMTRPRSLAIKGALATTAAWAEETLWRGAMFGFLEPKGIFLTLGLTTICFAAAHVYGQGWPAFGPHLITGLSFGLLYVVSGSLGTAIVAHVVYNGLVVLADHGRRDSRYHAIQAREVVACL